MKTSTKKDLANIILYLGLIGVATWFTYVMIFPRVENYEYDERQRMRRNRK